MADLILCDFIKIYKKWYIENSVYIYIYKIAEE